MSSQDLISVVIPAFNARRFIGETVESVLAQTHEQIEVVVVDDGSTDETREAVRELRRRDARVTLLEQSNSGVSVARNAGAAVSRGAFITFLDADDMLTPDSLQLRLERLDRDRSLGLVHCDYQRMNAASSRFGGIHVFPSEGRVLDELLLLDERSDIFSLGSCLLRMEVFNRVGGFDPELSNSADHEFFFRVANLYGIGRVPQLGFYYRIHSNNMHSNIRLLEKDLLAAYRKADQHRLFRSSWFRRQCYGNMYSVLAGCWWNDAGDRVRGGRYVLRALWVYPPAIFRFLRKIVGGRLASSVRKRLRRVSSAL